MAVSFHSHSVRCDAEDLERAAGLFLTKAKEAEDARQVVALHSAACVLHALAFHDMKTEKDMFTIWNMLFNSGEATESEV